MLVTAAVAGALFAALPLGLGSAAGTEPTVTVPLSVLGNGMGSDAAQPFDFDGDALTRQELAAAEQARLEVLRAEQASRDADRAAADAAAAAAAAEAARPTFVSPTRGRLTSCFCPRWGTMHWGIDIAAPMLTPIYAAGDGVVTKAGPASGYGNVIYLQHDNGDVTVYGHMEVVGVRVGEVVSAGQLIAKVGSRGYSTGPHLHFEVYAGGLEGRRVDPIDWLAARGVRIPQR